jgi:hypothetical protein
MEGGDREFCMAEAVAFESASKRPRGSTAKRPDDQRLVTGPYSRMLRHGALGKGIDGSSVLGRFIRDLEAQLVAHVGGRRLSDLSIAQQLMINRVVKTEVQIRAFDEKIASGTWTDLDARTFSGLLSRQRMLLVTLGIERATPAEARRSLRDLRGAA